MTGIVVAAIIAIPCITVIASLWMVLRFCLTLVEKNNGDTKCLRDPAVVLRAFPAGPGGLLSGMVKMLGRR